MSEFATSFFAHMLASDMKYPIGVARQPSRQYLLHSVNKVVLDPRETFNHELLFTSTGDSEYYDCRSVRNEDTDTNMYHNHLFVIPRSGDIDNVSDYIVYFDTVAGAYRISKTPPLNYGFGKPSSRGYLSRGWGERSAVDIDVEPTVWGEHSVVPNDVEPTGTFNYKWNELANQAWGSSKLGNWADESADTIEEDINPIEEQTIEGSAGYSPANTVPTEAHRPSGIVDNLSLRASNENDAQPERTVTPSSFLAPEVPFAPPIVSEQEEVTRLIRALSLECLSTGTGMSRSVDMNSLTGLALHGHEEIALKGHSYRLQLPIYCPPSQTLELLDQNVLDDSPEVTEVKELRLAKYIEKQAAGEDSVGCKLAHGISAVGGIKQTMFRIEESEEEEEEEENGEKEKGEEIGIGESTCTDSDEGSTENEVPMSVLRSQVLDFSHDEIHALRWKWNNPGMALLELTWQSMARAHKDMVQKGLYIQKRLEASEPADLLSLMGIEDRSVLDLAKGLKLLSYGEPVIKEPRVVHHYNYYGESIYYPTHTSKLHSLWAPLVRKDVNGEVDLRKYLLVTQAKKTVDAVSPAPPLLVYARGSKGLTRALGSASFGERSYWPKRSSMAHVECCHEEHAIQLEAPVLEDVDAEDRAFYNVNKTSLRVTSGLEKIRSDCAGQYLEAQTEDEVNAENEDFYGVETSPPQAATEPARTKLCYGPHSAENNVSSSAVAKESSAGPNETGACTIISDKLVEDTQFPGSPDYESPSIVEDDIQEPSEEDRELNLLDEVAEGGDVRDSIAENNQPGPTDARRPEYQREGKIAKEEVLEDGPCSQEKVKKDEIHQSLKEISEVQHDEPVEEKCERGPPKEDQFKVQKHSMEVALSHPSPYPFSWPGMNKCNSGETLRDLTPSLLNRGRGSTTPQIYTGSHNIPHSRNISGSSGSTAVATPTSPPAKTLADLDETVLLKLSMLEYDIQYAEANTRELGRKLETPTTAIGAYNVCAKSFGTLYESEYSWFEALASLDKVGNDFDSKVKSLGAHIKGDMPEKDPPTDTPRFPPILLILAAAFLFFFLLF
ncbi:MAG: hypothetical protein M1836_007654 [Candelina mexicana]|nr:MAG: hypothetical protein M1836_007654 [Candelina mexicana]